MSMVTTLRAAALVALLRMAMAPLPPPKWYPGRTLILDEDFNGPLNTAVWTPLDGYVQTPWDIACCTSSNAYTENGNLVLRTRREDVWCNGKLYRYSTGWVDTLDKLTVREGVIEASEGWALYFTPLLAAMTCCVHAPPSASPL